MNSELKYKIQKVKNLYHLFQAILANLIYRFPSKELKVIGVTGTDGKTTTTHLIYHILKSAGHKTSMISSVYAKVGRKEYDAGFHVTTPDPFFIQKILRAAVESGDKFFVLETTSHALDQNRVWGVKYEIGVITNITHEHLDYHRTFEDYVKTKLKLLNMAKIPLVNEDDKSYKYIKNQKLKIKNTYKKLKIIEKIPNLISFNQYNYSAAYAVCKILGISDEVILNAMKSFRLPPGRLEMVYNKEFKVIIDFAHTPNAFDQVFPAVRRLYLKQGGRLIHVFGSAGLRDFTKRPLMGESSGRYTDLVILTEEDYRTEDPMEICLAIASGLEKHGFQRKKFDYSNSLTKLFEIIIDRKLAIKKAIKAAKKNDTVIITGKGHEKSLCRGKVEYPWSEHEAVKQAIKYRR